MCRLCAGCVPARCNPPSLQVHEYKKFRLKTTAGSKQPASQVGRQASRAARRKSHEGGKRHQVATAASCLSRSACPDFLGRTVWCSGKRRWGTCLPVVFWRNRSEIGVQPLKRAPKQPTQRNQAVPIGLALKLPSPIVGSRFLGGTRVCVISVAL